MGDDRAEVEPSAEIAELKVKERYPKRRESPDRSAHECVSMVFPQCQAVAHASAVAGSGLAAATLSPMHKPTLAQVRKPVGP